MNYFINNDVSLYDTPKLEVPDVETYIIYTGKSIPKILSSGQLETDEGGKYILSLNQEFFGGERGKPELTAKVICSNNGSGIIGEYIRFSQIFDMQTERFKSEPDKAMQEIFKICERENILMGYLSQHRGEAEKIMLTMVSPEYIERSSKKTAMIYATIKTMRALGQSEDQIKEYLITEYHITPGYAQNCLDTNWEDENVF